MKNIGKRTIMVVGAVMLFSMQIIGCSSAISNTSETVATIDGTEIPIGVANFMAKYQQASYDTYYSSYFGKNMWSQDLYGDGKTLEESVKSQIMDSIKQMYILDAHKDDYDVIISDEDKEAINEAAKTYLEANSKDAIAQSSASEEIVSEVLRLYTIQSKMHKAMVADVNTEVSDEEAAQRTFSYIKYDLSGKKDDSGNVAQYTDDEKDLIKKQAQTLLDSAKAGQDFASLAKEAENNVSTYSYGLDESEKGKMDKNVIAAADALKEGQYADLVVLEDSIYIIRLDSEFDKTATETKKQSIVTDRQNAKYEEIYKGWEEESDFVINDSVWKKVNFKTPLKIKTEQTQASDEGASTKTQETKQ